MEFKQLLAKSCPDPDNPPAQATLVEHLIQVVEAVQVLDRFTENAIREILPGDMRYQMWQDALFCAAWLHDIGKANDHFQIMLRNMTFRQGTRHEAISVLAIELVFQDWLKEFWSRYPTWFHAAVLFSIGGHHLKFPDNRQRNGILRSEITFLAAHPDMQELLSTGQSQLQLPDIPVFQNQTYGLVAFEPMEIKALLRKVRRKLKCSFSLDQQQFIAMLKSMVMCADLAGSALPAKKVDLKNWLADRLHVLFKPDDLKRLIRKKIGNSKLKRFQQQMAESNQKTILVEAGCGAGKTIAAYQWAAKKANNKKLFFCYPTTATASEGFSNYLYDPDFEALLVHSRVSMDYRLLENMPPRSGIQRELQYLGLEALDMWPAVAVVCTAHTVLGLLQNTRRGIYSWPSLVRAVFVFDEIHAFSDLLFAHLLRFLQLFKHAPVLLMTATLPPHRKHQLLKACENRGTPECFYGPKKREQAKRYLLSRSDEQEAWEQCRQVIAADGKVLWICNTVARAMQTAKLARDIGLPVQPYHSRYRYIDRLVRQRTVIDGFSPGQPAMLAVTTQVAEMSLDLSADLLVTEYAPVPSLIQRLGRLNRFADQPKQPGLCLLLQPENGLPYAKKTEENNLWQQVNNWLNLVADRQPKSQQDLSHAFLACTEIDNVDLDMPYCDWIDDPWRSETNKHAIMEPAYTVELVREEDHRHRPLAEVAIPMPFPRDREWAWEYKGKYIIAPAGAIQYDPFWGGEYAKSLGFEII